ncbi:MAG: hypothetical protein ACRD0D_02585 [Acidimicrobiales bacterium]
MAREPRDLAGWGRAEERAEGGGPTDPDDQVDELMAAVGRMLSR